ncbi:hypothetical protein INN71_15405 [Nocardioides sp. ChNu-153]|uniref:hypothetical protein n=1 Tax=Nocardioides sp. ChNu-153 TaxID=2779364 RepID=UPI002655D59A|nr:hypothetical protein [Nocardioides sp. ChNu-153]MDN7122776.1 hypothetical protein [Nocardioides sp. ChNu-153]
MTTTGWTLRLARGGVLALVVLLAGGAGHALAGGALPSPLAALPLLLLLTAGSALLLGRRVDALETTLLLVVGQAATHLGLMVLAPGPAGAPHAHPTPVDAGAGDLAMVAFHLLAAAVGGLWLAAGERAVWTLLDLALVRPVTRLVGRLVARLVGRWVLLLRARAAGPARRPRGPLGHARPRPATALVLLRPTPPRAPPRPGAPAY